MTITHIATSEKRRVVISLIKNEDFKVLAKKNFFFNWKLLKGKATIYKLEELGEHDILGAIAIKHFTQEARILIELIACSRENIGKNKMFTGIAGCLIAFIARMCLEKYGSMACVSLIPKTELKQHYIRTYKMSDAGWQLYLDGQSLLDIIKNFGYA